MTAFDEALDRYDALRAEARVLKLRLTESTDDIRSAAMLIRLGRQGLIERREIDRDRFLEESGEEQEAILQLSRLLLRSALDLAKAAVEGPLK